MSEETGKCKQCQTLEELDDRIMFWGKVVLVLMVGAMSLFTRVGYWTEVKEAPALAGSIVLWGLIVVVWGMVLVLISQTYVEKNVFGTWFYVFQDKDGKDHYHRDAPYFLPTAVKYYFGKIEEGIPLENFEIPGPILKIRPFGWFKRCELINEHVAQQSFWKVFRVYYQNSLIFLELGIHSSNRERICRELREALNMLDGFVHPQSFFKAAKAGEFHRVMLLDRNQELKQALGARDFLANHLLHIIQAMVKAKPSAAGREARELAERTLATFEKRQVKEWLERGCVEGAEDEYRNMCGKYAGITEPTDWVTDLTKVHMAQWVEAQCVISNAKGTEA